jgi:hypothetical protein
MFHYFFSILYIETLSIIMHWYSLEIKSRDITCLHFEIADIGCIDFITLGECGSIMAKDLLEMSEVDVRSGCLKDR